MTESLSFIFSKSQRELFRSEELIHRWSTRYPELFDDDDKRVLLTEHQRQYHFHEWLAAVLLFEATGYRSLVIKYTARTHPMKGNKLRQALPQSVAEWVFAHESGQPDLFVYSSAADDWFFCEVKGPGDIERANQKEWRAEFLDFIQTQGISTCNRSRVLKLIEIAT